MNLNNCPICSSMFFSDIEFMSQGFGAGGQQGEVGYGTTRSNILGVLTNKYITLKYCLKCGYIRVRS